MKAQKKNQKQYENEYEKIAKELSEFCSKEVFRILFLLADRPHYTREICYKVKMSLRRVSTTLTLLEVLDLVKRYNDTLDNGVKVIYNKLTEKGEQVVELLRELYNLLQE